jgi:hypothetical protein
MIMLDSEPPRAFAPVRCRIGGLWGPVGDTAGFTTMLVMTRVTARTTAARSAP